MIGKPVILYIDSPYGHSHGPNRDREALSCFLSHDCGCELRLFDCFHDLKESKESLYKLARSGWFALVIFRQNEYMENEDLDNIKFIRSEVSSTVPIMVIPKGWKNPFVASEAHPNVVAFSEYQPEFTEFIRQKISEWGKPPDIFGVQNTRERDVIKQLLLNAYQKHNLNSDNEDMMLGAPDPNTQVVLEALRLKMIPTQFIKQEFDDTIPRRKTKFAPMEPTVYEKEYQKILLLDHDGRNKLAEAMLHAQGMSSHPSGGVICHGVGRGENASGFAIDWQTLLHTITDRFGEHELAKSYLRDQLVKLEELRHPGSQEREYFGDRMICGLILKNVEGYQTPLACLWPQDKSEEEQQRVTDFLLKDRRFIPVTIGGYIFGKQPIPPQWQGPPLPPLSGEEIAEMVRIHNDELEQTGTDG